MYPCTIRADVLKKTQFSLCSFLIAMKSITEKQSDIWEKNRKCLELFIETIYATPWRGGRVVEGAPLLRE